MATTQIQQTTVQWYEATGRKVWVEHYTNTYEVQLDAGNALRFGWSIQSYTVTPRAIRYRLIASILSVVLFAMLSQSYNQNLTQYTALMICLVGMVCIAIWGIYIPKNPHTVIYTRNKE